MPTLQIFWGSLYRNSLRFLGSWMYKEIRIVFLLHERRQETQKCAIFNLSILLFLRASFLKGHEHRQLIIYFESSERTN